MHHVNSSKVQAAKRRSYARFTRTSRFRFSTSAFSIAIAHEAQRQLDLHEHVGVSVAASAVCAKKPGSSRRHQRAFVLRLRSAVRGCRRDVIGFFGVIPLLAMHMRISRRFTIPEHADHTHEIRL